MSKHVSDIANNASPTDVIGGDDFVITGNPSTERFKAIPSSRGFVSKLNLKKAILSYLGIVFPAFTQAEIDALQGISEHYVIENSNTGELIRWTGTQWLPLGSGSDGSQDLSDVLAHGGENSYQPIIGGNFLHADDNNIDVLVNAQSLPLIQIGANNELLLPGFAGSGGNYQKFQTSGDAGGWVAADMGANGDYILYILSSSTEMEGSPVINIDFGSNETFAGKLAWIVNLNNKGNFQFEGSYTFLTPRGDRENASALDNGATYLLYCDPQEGWNLINKFTKGEQDLQSVVDHGDTITKVVDDRDRSGTYTATFEGDKISLDSTSSLEGQSESRHADVTAKGLTVIDGAGNKGAVNGKSISVVAANGNFAGIGSTGITFNFFDVNGQQRQINLLTIGIVPPIFETEALRDAGIPLSNQAALIYVSSKKAFQHHDGTKWQNIIAGEVVTGTGGSNKYLKFNQSGQDYFLGPLATSLPA